MSEELATRLEEKDKERRFHDIKVAFGLGLTATVGVLWAIYGGYIDNPLEPRPETAISYNQSGD